MIPQSVSSRFSPARALFAAAILAVAGCASAPAEPGALIADPYESTNRSFHAFNKGVDTVIVRPVAQAYDFATPELFKHLLGNGLQHLRLPGIFINRLLQGDAEAAGEVLGRFTLNTLMGAG
ncbi:MAG: MlaA family lipoprotein, partial [Pseudomonadota bacterium]